MTGAATGQARCYNGLTWRSQCLCNGVAAMTETKPATHSVTIVANLLTVLALGLGLLFKEFGPAEQAAFVEAGSGVVAAVLQLVSIWGRVRATARIHGVAEM